MHIWYFPNLTFALPNVLQEIMYSWKENDIDRPWEYGKGENV